MIPTDKLDQLEARAVALVDLFIAESDPTGWPSTDTKQGRGDRVWMKKNCVQTLAIVEQIRRLVKSLPIESVGVDDEGDPILLIEEAEAAADRMLARAPIGTPN